MELSVPELISTTKKKKKDDEEEEKVQAANEWSNILPKSSQARKKPPPPLPPHISTTLLKVCSQEEIRYTPKQFEQCPSVNEESLRRTAKCEYKIDKV